MINVALSVIMWAAAIASWTFPVLYSILAPWWRSETGRMMFGWSVLVGLLFVMIGLSRVLGHDYPGQDVVRLICYGALAVMLWRWVALLVRLQIRRRAKSQDEHY